MKRNILVVASHPDDEILGCAGTIARHVNEGDCVHIHIVAEGATSRSVESKGGDVENHLISLRNSANKASQLLGVDDLYLGDFPDNKLDTVPLLDIIKTLEKKAQDYKPTIVYTHHSGDLNIDHQIVSRAAMTAFRPQPSSSVESIYTFETVSSTEWGTDSQEKFKPTRFVDITNYLDTKRDALLCYSSEMREFPHARSIEAIEALAKFRGASVGLNAAEAFMQIRDLVR
ncbi:MAG: GlcNAc-PI de-N-acetylase [Rhodospirillaceae bacterium]|nr:GlcNAc-PI de-N-acetylase [Rhodospirillaceae bacterium]|tara:strand:+ start:25592 stop:26281 length:690 start_codon:yes stop_codon:yes gene_type:complete